MTTAVFTSTPVGENRTSSKFLLIAKRVINALVESRARSVAMELRRREAFMRDIGRKQEHSPAFLEQSDLLPFKI